MRRPISHRKISSLKNELCNDAHPSHDALPLRSHILQLQRSFLPRFAMYRIMYTLVQRHESPPRLRIVVFLVPHRVRHLNMRSTFVDEVSQTGDAYGRCRVLRTTLADRALDRVESSIGFEGLETEKN